MVCNAPSAHLRSRAARRISQYIKLQSLDLSGELLVRLQEDLNNRILRLIKSPKVKDRLGAIETIYQLVSDGDASKDISNFAEYLLIVLQNPVEETLIPVTRTLGYLSSAGTSAVSRTWVDKYMILSFEWLRMDGTDNQIRRLTGIMVLRAICKNEQTVFYQHIQTCIRILSSALFDPSLEVRVIATEVLAEALQLVLNRDDGSERHSRDVIKWFDTIFDSAVAGMKRGSDSSIHGSLMTFGVMLLNGQYLSPKLPTVYDFVLENRHRRDANIRKSVLDLIPKLANYRPRYFIQNHMPICLKYVMKKCYSNSERGEAFLALGKISISVGELISPYIPDIMPLLQRALQRKYFCRQALLCISMLARATPNTMFLKLDSEMPLLLENMFSDGLVPRLIESLREIIDLYVSLPSSIFDLFITHTCENRCNERGSRARPIRRAVQRLLMDEISMVLAGKPYEHPGQYLAEQTLRQWRRKRSGIEHGSEIDMDQRKMSEEAGKSSKTDEKLSSVDGTQTPSTTEETTPQSPKSSKKKTWSLFGSFNTSTKQKQPESMESPQVQGTSSSSTPKSPTSPDHDRDLPLVMLALETLGSFPLPDLILLGFCRAHVLPFLTDRDSNLRRQAAITCTRLLLRPNIPVPSRSVSSALVCHTLSRLLEVAIGDPESTVRFAVIEALTPRFDEYLAQAQNLRVLFIALNDEVFRIRLATIRVIARLTDLNPAYILPALRQTLVQILVELRYGSTPRPQEEGARLLTHLIDAAPSLVRPYLPAIIRALLPRLTDKNVGVATAVLGTIEKVAQTSVGRGAELMRHIEMLLPPIIQSLEDHSSARKRQVSLAALSRLIVCT